MARCQLCKDQEKRDEADIRLGFDCTPDELVTSAFERRCSSCIVILEGIRQSEAGDSWPKDVRRVYARCLGTREGHIDSLSLEVYFVDERPKLELEFYSLQPHAWNAILPRPRISGHPLSRQALIWVRELLDVCVKSHVSCKSESISQLPKRVLWNQLLPDGSISIRLVEPEEEHAPFAALSHCWGTEQTCTTTSDTIVERKNGIPWESIPKTFRHAIFFALQLDIPYLWIDSLCILQNDVVDWQIESSKMADIYQNAHLTLAATSSPGDSHGCFSEVIRPTRHIEINLPVHIGACRIAIRRPLKHWNSVTPQFLDQRFPLLSRAWAFQERILAKRVIHFCDSELIWECRTNTVCECGGLGQNLSPSGAYYYAVRKSEERAEQQRHDHQYELDLMMALQLQQQEEEEEIWKEMQQLVDIDAAQYPPTGDIHTWFESESSGLRPPYGQQVVMEQKLAHGQYQTSPSLAESWTTLQMPQTTESGSSLPNYNKELPKIPEEKSNIEIVQHYHRILEQYSALRLTKPTDRLPALSGLAKRIQNLRGEYKAGLWSDSICFDLLWRIDFLSLEATNGGRASEYRGPSWSWVSVESPIKYWSDIVDFKDDELLFQRRSDDAYEDIPVSSQPLGRSPNLVRAKVQLSGLNEFGEVSSALLTAEASYMIATLEYTYASYPTNALDPAQYKLRVTTARENAFSIPFFADYMLSVKGPRKINEGAKLTLLLIHPMISLVLRRKFENNNHVMIDNEPAWERVGIARISDALVRNYRIHWLRKSTIERARRFYIV